MSLSHWCHPIELWLFSIQIFGKQIHTWIKLVSVWKGDHKCLAWDRFPSPILDESRLLRSCRLICGHPLSGGFIFKTPWNFLTSESWSTQTHLPQQVSIVLKPRKETWESVSLKTLQRFSYKIPTSLSCYFQNSLWGKKENVLSKSKSI